MSKRVSWLFSHLLIGVCLAAGSAAAQTIDIDFNFRNGALGWTSGFADYPPATNQSGFYQLDSGIRYTPRKLTQNPVRSYYIQGYNFSGGLMMFLKRRLTASDGIVAGRRYRIDYVVKFASNAASGCVGIGAPPGEGVFLRVGGSAVEPKTELQTNGWLVLNIDLATATADAGNIANGLVCETAYPIFPFISIQRPAPGAAVVTATPSGDVWLFLGTVSLFEGPTRLYYQNIQVRLVPV